MPKERYCLKCEKYIKPKKKFNWLVFLFFGYIIYSIYYLFIKKEKCPLCSGTEFGKEQ